MDLAFTEEQNMLVQAVRRFIREEVIPLEQDMDPDAYEIWPADKERLVGIVKGMGLYQMDVPVEFGGPGVDLLTRCLLVEEMVQHRAGLYAPAFGSFGHGAPAQLYVASDYLKERYLWPTLRGEKRSFLGITEPSGGSDPARAIQTRAVRDGDDWVINGSKMFNSGAHLADYGVVFVRTGEGRQGISSFIVDTDTPGFVVRRIIHTVRVPDPACELSFEDMRVPHSHLLGEVGRGFELLNDNVTSNRVPYSSSCIGIAVAAHRMATEYSRHRVTFGEPLAARQGVQWMLVDNEIDIRCARLITLDAADKAMRGQPYRFEASMAKYLSSEMAGRVVDRAMQIHGGYGVTKDLPLERWWRELRIRRIGEGPSEVQRVVMARDIVQGPRG